MVVQESFWGTAAWFMVRAIIVMETIAVVYLLFRLLLNELRWGQ